MSIKTVLDDIGTFLKGAVTNPTALKIETGALDLIPLFNPAFTPLVTGINNAIAAAAAKAAMTAPSSSIVLNAAEIAAAAQDAFNAYQQSTGVVHETAQQEAIVNAAISLVESIGTGTATAPVSASITIAKAS